jgi:hypothetical protein
MLGMAVDGRVVAERAGVPGCGQSRVRRWWFAPALLRHNDEAREDRAYRLWYASLREQFLNFNVSPADAAKSSTAACSYLRQLPTIRFDCVCFST